MKTLLLTALFACLLVSGSGHAQTWLMVAPESQSNSVTLPAGTIFRFGNATDNLWSTPVALVAVTTFNPVYFPAGQFPFADPDPNVVKELDVLETYSPQTATLNGAPFAIPALPVLTVACPLPAASNANPKIPAAPPNCSPVSGAVAVGPDGSKVTDMQVATPVYFQYCAGTVCDAPFMFVGLPIMVGPNARCGGPPITANPAAPGTLYVIPAARQNTVHFTDPGGVLPHVLPVLPKPPS